jgi:hypothetical protein
MLVNLTKVSDKIASAWLRKICIEMTKYYYKSNNRLALYYAYSLISSFRGHVDPYIPSGIKDKVGEFLRDHNLRA